MKKFKFLAAVCCMAAVFAACEKNEPSDNTDGNGVNTDQNDGPNTDQNDGNSNSGNNSATGTANGHEWVDLGLPSGLKWATCNVGATKPEEYGNYYAWGETTTKETYSWATYKWCNGSDDTLTKYNTNGGLGTVDNKTVLDLEDDAARANWGGAWRMPTDGEWGELLDECTWEWKNAYKATTAGYLVTSKINGNSIFLPAAGYRYNDVLDGAGNLGYCWSSSLYTGNPIGTWYVYFGSDSVDRDFNSRYFGYSVRPVLGE